MIFFFSVCLFCKFILHQEKYTFVIMKKIKKKNRKKKMGYHNSVTQQLVFERVVDLRTFSALSPLSL